MTDEVRGVEVDVAPAEAEDLAASHAGVGGDPERGVVAVVAGRGEERAELWAFHTRDVLLDSGRRLGAWAILAGLVRIQPAADGVVEGAAQDHVDLDDGLVVEPARAVGASVVEQVGVEPLEVIGPEVPQRDPSDPRARHAGR